MRRRDRGGHDAGRGWNSNASRWVRICANKGVKDIFGELARKGLHPLPPEKKNPAEEGNDTASQFPACNQASLISAFYLMAKVWEGAVGGVED